MPRRKSGAGVTVGFYGTGEMDIEAAMVMIDENLKSYADEPLRFMFVITSDEFSDTLGELVQLAINSDIPYEAITSPNDKARRTFTDAFSAASKTHSVEDPLELLRSTLAESAGGRLMMLWDKDREDEMQEVASAFLEDGVAAYDLIDAMTAIGFPKEEEPEVAETPTGEQVFARSDLQKMSREELRDVAGRLGIPARRASATMIEDILDAQEGPTEPEPVEPEPVDEEAEEPVPAAKTLPVPEEVWEKLDKSLDQFTNRLLTGLEDLIARISSPAAPSTPPSSSGPSRRLTRRGS
jgi:hypothetical protein